MAKNVNLHKAKKEANDEFYTQYEDIAKEIEHYKEHLKGKVIYCNCDIPHFSNFHKYFLDNFKEFELKKLIVTGYVKNGNGKCSIYDGEKSTNYDLLGDGDFRGDECIDMLQKADAVITNPPFSLFREFIKVVVDNDKDFIVVGSKNAITYNSIFPMLMNNDMFIGVNNVSNFILSKNGNYDTKNTFVKDSVTYAKFGNIGWFTSFNVRENEYLELSAEYFNLGYPKYNNYEIINVDKVKDIPKDYYGIMGVPITFLDKYNSKQFEILGIANNVRYIGLECYTVIKENPVYNRILIKCKTKEINDTLQNK